MTRRLFDDDDEVFPARAENEESPHIDFTPMIDCVVLLLGFFMVTSNLGGRDEVDVPPASHGTSFPKDDATIITLKAPQGEGQPAMIFLGERSNRQGRLGEGEESVTRYVEEGLQRNNKHVMIKADREVTFGDVREVMRAVTAVQGVSFSIAVRDRRDSGQSAR